VLGGREVGLADAEIDDRPALGGERVGARQHLERRFGAERRHPVGNVQHQASLSMDPRILEHSPASAQAGRRRVVYQFEIGRS
jgi:hypothetical protein